MKIYELVKMLLYDTTKNNIYMHLKNIFDKGELQKDSVVKKFLTTASGGNVDNAMSDF